MNDDGELRSRDYQFGLADGYEIAGKHLVEVASCFFMDHKEEIARMIRTESEALLARAKDERPELSDEEI